MDRRSFIKKSMVASLTAGMALNTTGCMSLSNKQLFFEISLAQWSLHRTIRKGELTTLDFPALAKSRFGIHAVEYVNQFFIDKAKDKKFFKELKQRTDDQGVKNVLIMIDAEGELGNLDHPARHQAVENHYKWIEAANSLGCHAIRVNAAGKGSREEVSKAAIEGLHELSVFAKDFDINVIVENHGGYSSEGNWIAGVMNEVGLDNCGTLPDFGNFYEYDKYQGVKDMMPFAKGVSAKSNNFDQEGNESAIDYNKMLQIVKNANYHGYIGIEYEGPDEDEFKGIDATKQLLVKVGNELS